MENHKISMKQYHIYSKYLAKSEFFYFFVRINSSKTLLKYENIIPKQSEIQALLKYTTAHSKA